jgi:uncharacterized protein
MHQAPKVSLLRVQPTPRCNLNCRYCYIPASVRRQKDLMSPEVLETLLNRLVDEDMLEDQLHVSWHGAEPLAAGLDWYRDAAERIDQIIGNDRVTHIFQSNGVLVDDDWCRFFASLGATVGLSIDGTAEQNLARVNWAGRPAHDAAMRGARRLASHGIPWILLSVITEAALDDPDSFIRFVLSTGCSSLGFKVEETNVAHSSALDAGMGIERKYARFVQALWAAFPEGGPVWIREFEDYRMRRASRDTILTIPVTLIPFRNLTVAVNGDYTIFSGELLFSGDDSFVFGNVMDGPLLRCLETPKFRAVSREIIAGARRCAAKCPNYAECGSFFISQKHAETGSFDADETLACRLEVKTLYGALDSLTQHQASALAS